MSTVIRPEISPNKKYWISKHRHYELKHFCLQYPSWKKDYSSISGLSIPSATIERLPSGNLPGDPTYTRVATISDLADRINLIEKVAKESDAYLSDYILRGVTEGLSYTYLKSRLNIPCSKDTYYDRYRRFFWLLDKVRD